MTAPQTKSRPWEITLIVVLAYLGFLAQILVSIASLVDADKLSERFGWGLNHSQIVGRGIAGIIVGVIGLVLTTAFARGNRVVRIVFTVLVALQIAGGLLAMRMYDSIRPGAGVPSVVFGIVILFLLFGRRSDEFFARD